MKKPTEVDMGILHGIYKLQRLARHARCHFEIEIEAYYVRQDCISEGRPVEL